jgi:hypothetical protein
VSRWCIITTSADRSLNYFLESNGRFVDVLTYDQPNFDDRVAPYDVVYFRDPFNKKGYDTEQIRKLVETIRTHSPDARSVDAICTYDDLLFEDKWRQYTLFQAFMPHTELLDVPRPSDGAYVMKARLSSRSKGVYFQPTSLPDVREEYIVQAPLDITKEYRVFVMNGEVVNQAGIRTPKTAHNRMRTVGIEALNSELSAFVRQITEVSPVRDFIGCDIAETAQGFKLIEVNRSPQFRRYNELAGVNLGTMLMDRFDALPY